MPTTTTIELLRHVSYLDCNSINGRVVNLMPLWDGKTWHQWIPGPEKMLHFDNIEPVECDYVGKSAASSSDLYVPFVDFMWQRASWPEVYPLMQAILDDIHNLGTSAAKLRHFFDHRHSLPPGGGGRFASTEIEYSLMLCRSIFDYVQEIVARLWRNRVRLNDPEAEERRKRSSLPRSFHRMVVQGERIAALADYEARGMPRKLTDAYISATPLFLAIKAVRDQLVHGSSRLGIIFDTERGFCVDSLKKPWCNFDGWRVDHKFNECISSVIPWLANFVLGTIGTCSKLVLAFGEDIQMPASLAPGFTVFVRGPHNLAFANLVEVANGGSPWW